jgi:hypothetical protein
MVAVAVGEYVGGRVGNDELLLTVAEAVAVAVTVLAIVVRAVEVAFIVVTVAFDVIETFVFVLFAA